MRVLDAVRAGDTVRVSVGWAIGRRRRRSCCIDADDALAAAKRGGKDRALSYA